jgi:hypothetical protein
VRIVLRWFAFGAPYSWFSFATRFKDNDEFVGAGFFREFAKKVHATITRGEDTGLMESLDSLSSSLFVPSLVHPIIREFYEHTSRFDLDYQINWNPLVRPFGELYLRLIAQRMQQLQIPLDTETLGALDSWLELIDLDKDGTADFRCWIRVRKDSRIPVYVGAYKTYRSFLDDFSASYVTVAFPIPGGTISTVLTPRNLDPDGMELNSRVPISSENGVYLIIPHRRSFTMIPAFWLSERFRLRPNPTGVGVRVQHDCFWFGIRAFTMHYQISRMRQRAPQVAARLLEAAAVAAHSAV